MNPSDDKPRQPVEHELKCWAEYFEAVLTGRKSFEIRKNDRDFRVGDTLWLREWVLPADPTCQDTYYTDRECRRTVSYITDFGQWQGRVVMGLEAPRSSCPPAPGTLPMPRELTAENGMKMALSGEFSIRPNRDDDTEYMVPWDTIKQIYRAAVNEYERQCNAPVPEPAPVNAAPQGPSVGRNSGESSAESAPGIVDTPAVAAPVSATAPIIHAESIGPVASRYKLNDNDGNFVDWAYSNDPLQGEPLYALKLVEAPRSSIPPHGCGDAVSGPLCAMNLDGSCPRMSCSYYRAPVSAIAPAKAE